MPDGPLAEEQILLVRMIHEHQQLAQERAARSVMTAKQVSQRVIGGPEAEFVVQIKSIEKAKEKAKKEDDQGVGC